MVRESVYERPGYMTIAVITATKRRGLTVAGIELAARTVCTGLRPSTLPILTAKGVNGSTTWLCRQKKMAQSVCAAKVTMVRRSDGRSRS